MESKSNFAEIVKPGLILMTITIVAAVMLSVVYSVTEPEIEKKRNEILQESLLELVPDAEEFELDNDIYIGLVGKEPVGKVMNLKANGYGGKIDFLVGLNNENFITGVKILSQQETPGLGANVIKAEFLDQFVGKHKDEMKLWKDGGEIDGITGATITSRAIVNTLNNNIQATTSTDIVTLPINEGDKNG